MLLNFWAENSGAVIVSDDDGVSAGDGALAGVATERDAARATVHDRAGSLDLLVLALTTTAVVSCSPTDHISDVAPVVAERHPYHISVMNHISIMSNGRVRDVINIVEFLNQWPQDRRRVSRTLIGCQCLAITEYSRAARCEQGSAVAITAIHSNIAFPTCRAMESVMKVADILKAKGSAVMSVRPNETIKSVAKRFQKESVGALLVMSESGTLEGIITERDVSNGVANHGSVAPDLLASALMTTGVVTCSAQDTVSTVARIMTERRMRHLPVKDENKIVGVISIGDVLKCRLDEVQLETHVLRDLALASR